MCRETTCNQSLAPPCSSRVNLSLGFPIYNLGNIPSLSKVDERLESLSLQSDLPCFPIPQREGRLDLCVYSSVSAPFSGQLSRELLFCPLGGPPFSGSEKFQGDPCSGSHASAFSWDQRTAFEVNFSFVLEKADIARKDGAQSLDFMFPESWKYSMTELAVFSGVAPCFI